MSISNLRRCFHFNLDGSQAEALLRKPGVLEGTFLVRRSRTPNDFVCSVKRDGDKISHVRIRRNNEDGFDVHTDENFPSVTDVIQYYYENKKLTEKNGDTIELLYPYYADDPTPERWFHTSIDGKMAEQLLIEQGKNGSFLVRESQSVAGNYAVSIRTDDDSGVNVTHVIINCHNGQYDVGGGNQFDSLTDLIEHYRKHPMVQKSGTVMRLKYPFNATRVWAADIRKKIDFLEKMVMVRKRSGFREEFEAVQQNECKYLYDRKEGQRAENRIKNRFKNILPYDHTRVILKTNPAAAPYSDYINANYIQTRSDYEEFADIQKIYISCQGCLPNTIDDFWQMIWQEKCPVIVMITKEVELGKPKCAKYWPDPDKTKRHGVNGEICVTNKCEQVKPDYIIRELVLRCNGSMEERVVQHLQFTAWPDHGVPSDAGAVLSLSDQVGDCLRDSASSTSPVCVHCSAGIGRSGTFIAIDLVLSLLKRNCINSVIDISRTVQMIRSQRSGMVQTEAQYRFVYMAVQQYVETLRSRLAVHIRSESIGCEYTNIKYTAETSAACTGQQRTPTTPTSSSSVSSPWAPISYAEIGIKPITLDPPPLPKRVVPSK